MLIAAIILGLFAYGGYKRQQRQVATLAEGSMPHNVAPATAAGAEIAKDVPSGNVPNSPQQRRPIDSGIWCRQAICSRLRQTSLAAADRCSFGKHQFPHSLWSAQMPQPREPTPEERRLLAAYEREQQAIAAPTTLREGFGSPASGSSPDCRRRSQQWR